MRTLYSAIVVAVCLALSVSGCALVQAREEQEQQQQKVFEKHVDMAHIWVTTTEPDPRTKPYTKLGDLSYTVPFSPDAIDEAAMKEKLKNMAYEKWPDDIDAIIKENSQVSADGNTVTVSAEAIKYDSSTDRTALHQMNQNLVASPSGN
ncbi:MAG TPA: hypothetical protein VEJ86_09825 [Candidatus Binataceae bacterium]|nr:hypothetical protein [Candidatus Binataceae bacterium]